MKETVGPTPQTEPEQAAKKGLDAAGWARACGAGPRGCPAGAAGALAAEVPRGEGERDPPEQLLRQPQQLGDRDGRRAGGAEASHRVARAPAGGQPPGAWVGSLSGTRRLPGRSGPGVGLPALVTTSRLEGSCRT